MIKRTMFFFTFLVIIILINCNDVNAQDEHCKFVYGKESSVLVFSGEVMKIKKKQVQGSKFMIKFKVDSIYKGDCYNKVFIYTSVNTKCLDDSHPCDLCGFKFEKGKRYIVYVCSQSSGISETNKCTFTKEISNNENVIIESDMGIFPDLGC